MELRLSNGNYVPDGRGGFETVEGIHEVLQRILFKLTARKGKFPLMPELGSNLYLLCREKPGDVKALAEAYISQALEDEDNIELTDINITYNDIDDISMSLEFVWNEEKLNVSVTV